MGTAVQVDDDHAVNLVLVGGFTRLDGYFRSAWGRVRNARVATAGVVGDLGWCGSGAARRDPVHGVGVFAGEKG